MSAFSPSRAKYVERAKSATATGLPMILQNCESHEAIMEMLRHINERHTPGTHKLRYMAYDEKVFDNV